MSPVWRTLLFVPGDRPERFGKALAAGAGAVIVDLEDAVAAPDKDRAREVVRGWLATAPQPVVLRINAADTDAFARDLPLCGAPAVAAVMVPKAEQPAPLAAVMRSGARRLIPLVESAAGFAGLAAVAGAPGVACLAFGSVDLQADLGLRDATEDDLLPLRLQLVLASRGAGIAPPIDGVSVAIDDEARLRDDALRARRLGFAGKLCIHPRQIAVVRQAFAPGADEVAWAKRVLAAAEAAGGGAVAVDGRMVDKPVLLRAQAVVREAGAGA